jgi:hypothetical protein
VKTRFTLACVVNGISRLLQAFYNERGNGLVVLDEEYAHWSSLFVLYGLYVGAGIQPIGIDPIEH